MLRVDKLHKSYISYNQEYEAVKGISFEIGEGEFVALVGPSGSGKTTIFNCITGFLKPSSGQVFLNQKELTNQSEDEISEFRSRQLGFVFQDFMLIDGLTSKENIFLPQLMIEPNNEIVEKNTSDLLHRFGISEIADKYPHEISGGQKQRVAICRALSNRPVIILADEPTGNLDSISSQKVIDAFLKAKIEDKTTIFMVTHDANAASHCDRVIGIKDGIISREIINMGNQQDFLDRIYNLMRSGDQ